MTYLDDLDRRWRLRADAVPLAFTKHSVERFAERIRPGLELDEVRRRLSHMLGAATISREGPNWHKPQHGTVAYLYIADVFLPLVLCDGELRATSVFASGQLSEPKRAKRASDGRRQRSGKAASRKAAKLERGRRRPPPEVEIEDTE